MSGNDDLSRLLEAERREQADPAGEEITVTDDLLE